MKFILFKIVSIGGLETRELLAYRVDRIEAAQAKLDDMLLPYERVKINYKLVPMPS